MPSRWNKAAIDLSLGALGVAAFAPLNAFPLAWFSLGGFYALLVGPLADGRGRVREGALIGGLFGFGGFLAGVSWIFVSLSTFGGMSAPVAALATLLFCAAMALYPALAGALFVALAPPSGTRRALVFAALWTLLEWLRGYFLTGFPWLATGYSQTPPSPLAGFVPLAGVHGASFLAALIGACLAEALRGKGGKGKKASRALALAIPALIVLVGMAISGYEWTAPQGDALRVALLQGNIAQDDKWRPEKLEESLRAYYELMRDNPAKLTVLPEAALPIFLDEAPEGYLDALKTLALRQDGDLLFGVVTGNRARYANSVVALGASGKQVYHKSHLVPFGEFTPPGFAWFMNLAHIPMSDFTPGEKAQAPFSIGGRKIAVNICYEDAFGREIVRALPEAELLVNVSNMAWFGDSLAPAQHLQIARVRALETGRMVLRATNTGLSAIIGADGAVRAMLPPFTRAVLTGEVRNHVGSTPYARWGDGPALAVSFLSLLLIRRRSAPKVA
jgi:apolipoprotein N-acyltransferase